MDFWELFPTCNRKQRAKETKKTETRILLVWRGKLWGSAHNQGESTATSASGINHCSPQLAQALMRSRAGSCSSASQPPPASFLITSPRRKKPNEPQALRAGVWAQTSISNHSFHLEHKEQKAEKEQHSWEEEDTGSPSTQMNNYPEF